MEAKEERAPEESKAEKELTETAEVDLPREELILTANPFAVLLFEIGVIAIVVTYIVLTTPRKPPFDDFIEPCLNLSCFQLENELSSSMNLSADPCVDFYEYTCGLWGSYHRGFEDQFHLLEAKVFSRLKRRLEEQKEMVASGSPLHATDKAAQAYLRCVDAYIKQADASSMIERFLFSKLSFWDAAVLSDKVKVPKSPREMLNILGQLAIIWNIPVLMKFGLAPRPIAAVQPREINPTVYVDYSVTIPLWKRHKDKFLTPEALAQCLRDFAGVASNGDGKDMDVAKLIQVDVSLTTKWSAAASSPERVPKYMRVKEITSQTLDAISWCRVFRKFLLSSLHITQDTEFYISDVGLLSVTDDILSDHDPKLMYQLVRFHVARMLAPFTSYKLLRSAFGNPPNDSALSELVTAECATAVDRVFPFAWAVFVFGPNVTAKQQQAQEQFTALKTRTRSALSVLQSDYRAAAEERLDILKPVVGWPKKFDDSAELDKVGSHNEFDQGPFIEDYLDAVERRAHGPEMSISGLWSEKETAASFRPFKATAMYSPWLDRLYVSPTILFDPFLVESSDAFTWGAFGHVLAHELWHAAFGDLTVGFSAATDVVLSAVRTVKHDCIANSVADAGGDSKTALLSAPEDVVDVTGLQTAYEVFNSSSGNTAAGAKGAAGFTPQQLFYIGSCYKWCAENGHTSPLGSAINAKPFLRCNVPLMMVDGFSEAFRCAQESPMMKFRRVTLSCNYSDLNPFPNS
ncbi:endothelin-converting enzyme 1-like [Amblyomma americanum]